MFAVAEFPVFLLGTSEMAVLVQNYDWSQSPLGCAEKWPQVFRTVLRLILNTRHPMVVFWGPSRIFLYNDAYAELVGPERHPGALGQPGQEVWAEIWHVIGPQIARVMAGDGATWHENELIPITRRGTLEDLYWTYSYSPIHDEEAVAGIGGVLVVCTETTGQIVAERRQAERAATEAAARDRVWNNSRDLLAVIGGDGVFHAVNPAWKDILGYEPATLVGCRIADIIWADDAERTWAGLVTAARSDLSNFENQYRHRDGTPRWISWNTAADGEMVYWYGRDITAQKIAQSELAITQEALRQSQKMEAIGQLTGGIAHDFNNMLQAVTSGIRLAQRRIDAARLDEASRFLDAAVAAAGRAASLTRRLLAFGRRQALDPKSVDPDELIKGLRSLIQRTVGPAITLELNLQDGCWPVMCDPNQMENALLNLAINARDAMAPGGGCLLIETSHVTLGDAATKGWEGAAPGDYVHFAVRDTGTGMPPEVLAHAFEPFFTTKLDGQGTGLGLSQLYGFVRQSRGVVRLESTMGVGTSVHLYLPRSDGGIGTGNDADAEPARQAPRAVATLTVLLVEDEAEIRAFAAEALRERGYRVLEGVDGAAGLQALHDKLREPAGGGIDLLVTDIGLPGGLNGRQLADAARELITGLPVLLITGYAGDAINGTGRLAPGMEVLGKPFELDALVLRVQTMLDAARQPVASSGF